MNKSELREMLAELQKARAKVKVWQDDESPSGGIPNSYTPEKQAALLEASPFASSLPSFHKACMKTAFLPAEDQIETVMEIAAKKFTGKIPQRFVVFYLLGLQPQFTAIHYRLARAVQPMGKSLDPLAATVGAIRLQDAACSSAAAQHLSTEVIKAFQANDKATLARIKKLATTPIRNHRNFQVWLAIEEMITKRAQKAVNDGPQFIEFPMPTTSEIRRHVESNPRNASFNDLPGPDDHKGWTRLWKDSGAEMTIPKGVRGKKG